MNNSRWITYPVSTLAAALQPDARVVGNSARGELDSVVPSDCQLTLAILCLDVPAVDTLGGLVASRYGLGEHCPGVLEHVDVSASLVTGSSNDQINIKSLLVDEAIERTIVHALDLDLESVTLGVDAGNL